MSRNNPSQFGREDSFDWVNRKLAQTLGLGVAASPLRRDRPLDHLSEAEVKNFSNLLKSRLSRVADPKTGQIHYEMVQGGSDFIDDGQDPQLVSIAENYLPILKRAIRSIHGTDCCHDDLTTELGAADIAIDDLNEELRDAPSKVVIEHVLDVLKKHIEKIKELSEKGSPDLIQRASNAAADFENLDGLIRKRLEAIDKYLEMRTVHWWNYLVTRPMVLSHEAVELLRILSALGITREHLKAVEINPQRDGNQPAWCMWEFLQAAQDFPKLWVRAADAKRDPDTADDIANSVEKLHEVFCLLLPERSVDNICEDLGLLTKECCDEGRMIMARLKRFAKLGVTILEPLAAPLTDASTATPRASSSSNGTATNPGSPPSVFRPYDTPSHESATDTPAAPDSLEGQQAVRPSQSHDDLVESFVTGPETVETALKEEASVESTIVPSPAAIPELGQKKDNGDQKVEQNPLTEAPEVDDLAQGEAGSEKCNDSKPE
jgi:hypothetical protein